MKKPRKMLGRGDSPAIVSLMHAIETQSKETIAAWCLNYAQTWILPVFEAHCPQDDRPRRALEASRLWFEGKKKLPEVKSIILNECHAAARELEDIPAAQAAARACGQAAACFHTPTHSLGLAFYGCAALAYHRFGTQESPAFYEAFLTEECAKMQAALQSISIPNEPNPAKLNWRC